MENRIIPFEKGKKRVEDYKYTYQGTIKIEIIGNSLETATYYYDAQFLSSNDQLFNYLKMTLNDLTGKYIAKHGMKSINEKSELLINQEVSIDYYFPKAKNAKHFAYRYTPLTQTQMICILNMCIANLKQ